MNNLDSRIASSWLVAKDDLGIEVLAPFVLNRSDGSHIDYVALVLRFGATNGMLLLTDPHNTEAMNAATLGGYGYSCLYESYAVYKRELFVDTLNDWGWTGPEAEAPEWYTGQPWGE